MSTHRASVKLSHSFNGYASDGCLFMAVVIVLFTGLRRAQIRRKDDQVGSMGVAFVLAGFSQSTKSLGATGSSSLGTVSLFNATSTNQTEIKQSLEYMSSHNI
jgi:hypothetical protein